MSVNRQDKEYTKERNRAMKGSMKKILTLSLCVCMLASGTVYAQEESIEGQEKVILEDQETETSIEEKQQQKETTIEEKNNIGVEGENTESSIVLKGTPYDYDIETKAEAEYKDGEWIVDLSLVIGKDKISQVTPNTNMGNNYDSATGVIILPKYVPAYITFYVGTVGEDDCIYYKVDISYKSIGETINTFVIEKETDSKFTVDTSNVDIAAIYNDFGVGTDVASTAIFISEENTATQDDIDNKAYLETYVKNSGGLLQKVYPRVIMGLYTSNGDHNWIENNFGSITISLDAGIENAGKTAAVYQLYGANITLGEQGELIPYKNLTVDSNGRVTITTTKLTKSAFAIALQNELPVSNIVKTNTNTSEVKADISGINVEAIYKTFGIDADNTNAEIIVEQKEADAKGKEYLTNYAKKYGDKVLNIYDVVMNLYGNDAYKETVTDNFGSLTLSFYVGTEYQGKKIVVYQLHGEDEVIIYKDLLVDADGMVTVTVSKLSTFAVALQNSASTTESDKTNNTNSTNSTNSTGNSSVSKAPKTGDSVNISLWLVLAVFASFVIASAAMKRTRSK